MFKDFIAYRLMVRQKFGKTNFAIPVWLVVLLVIPFSQLVLIALLLALIAGYRLSFDRGR